MNGDPGEPRAAQKAASPIAALRARGLTPKKRFGQNFLMEPALCARIAEAATLPLGGTVIEIGPGTGALTRPLLERAARVIAVERDPELVLLLEEELGPHVQSGSLELVSGDGLEHDWLGALAAGPRPHVVAGNLPYLVTGRFLERAVTLAHALDRAVFMVQLEVADRLLAAPGTSEYGALTVFVRAAFDVERVLVARAGAFFPRPKVDSAVVALSPCVAPRATEDDAFRTLVRAAFGTRRKTLRNSWRGVFGWDPTALERAADSAGIDLGLRGERLAVEDFERMAKEARGG